MSKFLVLWSLDTSRLGIEAIKSVLSMPAYAEKMKKEKSLRSATTWSVSMAAPGSTTSTATKTLIVA